MIESLIIIWSLVLILGIIALRRSKATLGLAVRASADQGRMLLLRIPLAVLATTFLVELLPPELMRDSIGAESGIAGIMIASVAGALLPGGPFLSFPIAVALFKAGVGAPQMMALLTAWSVYAVHRTLNFELPMMGGRFILLRLASSIMIPPLVGIAAMLALRWISIE